jgi:hypothetical protein
LAPVCIRLYIISKNLMASTRNRSFDLSSHRRVEAKSRSFGRIHRDRYLIRCRRLSLLFSCNLLILFFLLLGSSSQISREISHSRPSFPRRTILPKIPTLKGFAQSPTMLSSRFMCSTQLPV